MNSPTAHQKAATTAGGTLVHRSFKPLPPPDNGGCGAPIHVVGTNGGTLPCGAMLTIGGKTKPYYCPRCEEAAKPEPIRSDYPVLFLSALDALRQEHQWHVDRMDSHWPGSCTTCQRIKELENQ